MRYFNKPKLRKRIHHLDEIYFKQLTAKLLNPSHLISVWCTKTSADPSSGIINPKPLVVSNHLHTPVALSADEDWNERMLFRPEKARGLKARAVRRRDDAIKNFCILNYSID